MSHKVLPFITVCMPVFNEAEYIDKTIGMILKQNYPDDKYEIFVADGNSTDNTVDIVKSFQKEYKQVKIELNHKRKASAGRNIGFKKGKGDIFLVIDGHCYIPDNQLFMNIVDAFKKSKADCLGRPQPLDPPDINQFQSCVAKVRSSKLGHGGDSLIYSDYEGFVSPVSHGAIYKREIFEKIGYVDEAFDACEDVEFNYRVEKAGFKAFMHPNLTIRYYPRKDKTSLFNQMVRYGKGRIQLLKKHPATFSITMIVPLLFLLGLFSLLILTVTAPEIGLLVSFFYFVYIIAIVSSTLSFKVNSVKAFINCISIYPIIHIGLGWGQLLKIVHLFKKNSY